MDADEERRKGEGDFLLLGLILGRGGVIWSHELTGSQGVSGGRFVWDVFVLMRVGVVRIVYGYIGYGQKKSEAIPFSDA